MDPPWPHRTDISHSHLQKDNHIEIDGSGKYLLPGCIDDQVHFREPGLTHKANIATESRAALAGGVTTFMEMPNTIPNALTQSLLEDKYAIAQQRSPANYSFYMGVSNENAEEVLRTNEKKKMFVVLRFSWAAAPEICWSTAQTPWIEFSLKVNC